MGLLPVNEETTKDITPKIFFIWGQSMHGKTYLARQFPSPIIINTDGNGKKISTPHVDVYDFETFVKVLDEIEEGNHTYKTIVIDLVDDIKSFLEDYVCRKHKVENLADAGFGKAYGDVKATWKRLMIKLTQLPYYVVFISHVIQITDEYDKNTTIEQPSLEQKYLNMTKGRTDVMIRCQKVGKNYLQMCNEKRDAYRRSDITDEDLMKALVNVKQLFDDSKPTIQTVETAKTPTLTVKQEKVFEEVVSDEDIKTPPVIDVQEIAKKVVKNDTAKKSLLVKRGGNE